MRPVSSTRAHLAFVSIDTHTATFASVAHLPIFDADASILRHRFDQACLPLLINRHVLLCDLPGDFQERLSQFRLFLVQSLHPAFQRLQDLQDQAQRLFSLSKLIPVTIECRFQACATHEFCSSLMCYLGQLPPLLVSHHAHDRLERVSHQILGILNSSCSPQRAAIQRGT